jgi:hypothetical protein
LFIRFDGLAGGGTIEQRKSMYAQMVNAYYTLATDFYEYGASLSRKSAREQ